MRKLSVGLSIIIILSALLAACSSGSTPSGNNINVTLTDFVFSPAAWSVKAGSQVSLTVINNGAVDHNWTLMSKAVTGSYSDADAANVIYKLDAPTGKTVVGTFTAPAQAGDYQVICTVSGHLEAGMIAKLTVTP